jgi:putative SOS response-associated peptidase YedK
MSLRATTQLPARSCWSFVSNHKTGERSLDMIGWGLIPHWCQDPKGGRKPINAKAETVSTVPMFSEAYAQRRCIVPVDSGAL